MRHAQISKSEFQIILKSWIMFWYVPFLATAKRMLTNEDESELKSLWEKLSTIRAVFATNALPTSNCFVTPEGQLDFSLTEAEFRWVLTILKAIADEGNGDEYQLKVHVGELSDVKACLQKLKSLTPNLGDDV